MNRIGPRMREAAYYVSHNPGTSILPVARSVGPNGSIKYGYEIVHRAISAGLIHATKLANGTYRLTRGES